VSFVKVVVTLSMGRNVPVDNDAHVVTSSFSSFIFTGHDSFNIGRFMII